MYSHGNALRHISTNVDPLTTHGLEYEDECSYNVSQTDNRGWTDNDVAATDDQDDQLDDPELDTSTWHDDPSFDTESERGSQEEWQDVPEEEGEEGEEEEEEEEEEFLELHDMYHTEY
jgi:hypothetical protein